MLFLKKSNFDIIFFKSAKSQIDHCKQNLLKNLFNKQQ